MKGQPQTLILAIAAFAIACADPTMPGNGNGKIPGGVSATVTHELFTFPSPGFPNPPGGGGIELCKQVDELDPGGTFTFSVTSDGTGTFPEGNTVTFAVGPGGRLCKTVYVNLSVFNSGVEQVTITENAPPSGWTLTAIDTRQLLAAVIFNLGNYTPPRLDDSEDLANKTATLYINNDMARSVTFTNAFTESPPPPPPPPVCDFITFGRLVLEVNGLKVVVSGNAGGNKPGGGILGEFHIEVNGTDHHVADISTYGPISTGPLSGLLNSRIVTGTDKDGHAVELRLWDGGEPGKGTDFIYFKIDGVEWLGSAGAFIDMGNMQYHANCRGP